MRTRAEKKEVFFQSFGEDYQTRSLRHAFIAHLEKPGDSFTNTFLLVNDLTECLIGHFCERIGI